MKHTIEAKPILGSFAKAICNVLKKGKHSFPGSKDYWEKRYQSGGNSGAGSYDKLGVYKAEILNDFVKRNHIEAVIEYGCGDGNQLALAEYPSYTGFDVSQKAITICEHLFKNDKSKQFKLLGAYNGETAQLTISLDVIYHLIEDNVFSKYMSSLFDSSTNFVIIYSSNSDSNEYETAPHVKHREFTQWVQNYRPQWKLIHQIQNKYPYIKNDYVNGSFSNFYIFSL